MGRLIFVESATSLGDGLPKLGTGIPVTCAMRTQWRIVGNRSRWHAPLITQHRYRLLFTALTQLSQYDVLMVFGVDEETRTLTIPATASCALYQHEQRVALLDKTHDHKAYADVFSWGQYEWITRHEMLDWGVTDWEQFFLRLTRHVTPSRRPHLPRLYVRSAQTLTDDDTRECLACA